MSKTQFTALRVNNNFNVDAEADKKNTQKFINDMIKIVQIKHATGNIPFNFIQLIKIFLRLDSAVFFSSSSSYCKI